MVVLFLIAVERMCRRRAWEFESAGTISRWAFMVHAYSSIKRGLVFAMKRKLNENTACAKRSIAKADGSTPSAHPVAQSHNIPVTGTFYDLEANIMFPV
jgi:hypothetical protein